jgi:hypothetical protein
MDLVNSIDRLRARVSSQQSELDVFRKVLRLIRARRLIIVPH